MPVDYRKLRLSQIAADLEETLCDLYWNAGEYHLESLTRQMEAMEIPENANPSHHLVELMEELIRYDADQLNPRAQELLRAAVDEINRLVVEANAG